LTDHRKVRARVGVAAIALGACLTAAACSSSGGSSSQSSAAPASTASAAGGTDAASPGGAVAAHAALAKLETLPTSVGFSAKVGKPVPTGKTVIYLSSGFSGDSIVINQLEAAAAILHWKLTVLVQGASATTVQAAWNRAVQLKPTGGIIQSSQPTAGFAAQCAQLAQLDIPVISYAVTTDLAKGYGGCVKGTIAGDSQLYQGGVSAGTFVSAQTGGKANVGFVTDSDFPTLMLVQLGIQKAFSEYCPGCQINSINIPTSEIGGTSSQIVVGYLRSHPAVNYVVGAFGSLMTGVDTAMSTAGLTVPIVNYDAQAPDVAAIASAGLTKGGVYGGEPESAWQAMDMLVRADVGVSLEPNQSAPPIQYIMTQSNHGSWPGSSSQYPWLLVANTSADYKAMWGIS
jgi:hypothetical protein